jgi:outer membrane receptor protein involved in Fe transport
VFGLAAQWSRGFGQSHVLVAGIDANQVRGASDEIGFTSGRATSLTGAGGRQATVAGYFEDLIKLNSRWSINVGARLDHWSNYAAISVSRPVTSNGVTSTTVFPDRSETAFSPRIATLYKITPHASLVGSVTRAFRSPTLNELYRSFRVGNVVTLANDRLRAERLTGAEAGIRIYALDERVVMRGTGFWASVPQPVANVTLTTTPALITRQRQNLGRTRSRGLEIETEARLGKFWNLSAGYLLADATVVKFPANPVLEGLMIPQVARHQFTFQLRYANPSVLTLGLQGRSSSMQFEDDQNLLPLAPYFTLDLFASRRIARKVEAFLAIENLFNQRYEVGKTPVTTLGPPILLRAGVRIYLSR